VKIHAKFVEPRPPALDPGRRKFGGHGREVACCLRRAFLCSQTRTRPAAVRGKLMVRYASIVASAIPTSIEGELRQPEPSARPRRSTPAEMRERSACTPAKRRALAKGAPAQPDAFRGGSGKLPNQRRATAAINAARPHSLPASGSSASAPAGTPEATCFLRRAFVRKPDPGAPRGGAGKLPVPLGGGCRFGDGGINQGRAMAASSPRVLDPRRRKSASAAVIHARGLHGARSPQTAEARAAQVEDQTRQRVDHGEYIAQGGRRGGGLGAIDAIR